MRRLEVTNLNDNNPQPPVDPSTDTSPFPSASDMDLDMWRAQKPSADGSRAIEGVANDIVCKVYGMAGNDTGMSTEHSRDMATRRIEMLGDLYETLRVAADKLAKAGLDADEENTVLSEFVTPKPFKEG
jgi:hypothetical protein